MEDVNRYFNLIKHNVNLLDLLTGDRPKHLKDEDFSDWQVTVIFYISCIYMKTVCSLFDIDIQDHYTLHSMINTRKELSLYPISKDYRHIEEAARDARYEGRKFDKDYLIKRILEKYNKVRDCAVFIIRQKGINNVVHADIKPFLDRINK